MRQVPDFRKGNEFWQGFFWTMRSSGPHSSRSMQPGTTLKNRSGFTRHDPVRTVFATIRLTWMEIRAMQSYCMHFNVTALLFQLKTMRQSCALFVGLWMLVQPVVAQTFRVATWDLDGLEASVPDSPPSEADLNRLRQIAANLRPLNADVLLLHGLPDAQFGKRLAGFLKPATYQVVLHSSFRKASASSVIVGPPITILSRRQPFAARATEWRSPARLHLP